MLLATSTPISTCWLGWFTRLLRARFVDSALVFRRYSVVTSERRFVWRTFILSFPVARPGNKQYHYVKVARHTKRLISLNSSGIFTCSRLHVGKDLSASLRVHHTSTAAVRMYMVNRTRRTSFGPNRISQIRKVNCCVNVGGEIDLLQHAV